MKCPWRTIRRLVLGVLPVLLAFPLAAQQGTVAGRVVAQTTGEPLSGVQIAVEGTQQGTLTDVDGRFRLTGLSGTEVTLLAVMIGYRTARETVAVGATDVHIALTTSAVALDELVVTGTAGETRARAIGNAVGKVRAEELVEIAPPLNIQTMLTPQVPGLRFMKASGAVGTGGVTRIRGAGSLTLSSEPLIFVDGIRINNESADGGAAFRDGPQPSRINDLNPDEIASIEVIKGPAAATLYGTEASNGVIQIITKRGRSGESRFNLMVSQGATFLPNPIDVFEPSYMMEDGQLIEFHPLRNDLELGLGSPFSTGHNQTYGLSVRGGTDRFLYYLSGEYDREEGIVDYNWKNAVSTRANFNYIPSSKFEIATSLGYVRSRTRTANVEQPFTSSIIWANPATRNSATRGYGFVVPEAAHTLEGYQDVDRVTGSISLKHEPFEWLSQRFTFGSDIANVGSSAYWPRHPDGAAGPYASNSLGRKDLSDLRSSYMTLDYSATGTLSLGSALNFATSVGTQYYSKQGESDYSRGLVFPVSGVETVSATASRYAEEDFVENKTFGLYVQEQIGWRDRMFLTGALRGDDNSAFGQNYDFVVYPKLSGTWVASEESFWGFDFVNSLKLRAAWGKAGQQPDVFAAARLYAPSVGRDGQPVLEPSNLGNPDLEPEVSQEIELGFDAGLWADRLALEFTYYDQTTDGAIVSRPALPSNGFPGSQFINIGEVANSGIELGLRGLVVDLEDFAWDVGFTFSTNHNEVVDLGGVNPGGGDQRNVEGWPLMNTFMKRVVSAEFDAAGNVINIMCEGPDPSRPLEVGMIVGGGPPVPCDEAGTADFGQPLPKWEGSFSSTLTLFDDLRLLGLVDFVGGHTRRDGDIAAAHLFFYTSKAIVTRSDPILAAYDAINGLWQAGMIKGGFAKLRNLSATYTLPLGLSSRFGAGHTTLTFSADNVATLWVEQESLFGREPVDHEVRSSTNEFSNYNQEQFPQPTRLSVMLRTTF